jgi:hypothetical protein
MQFAGSSLLPGFTNLNETAGQSQFTAARFVGATNKKQAIIHRN